MRGVKSGAWHPHPADGRTVGTGLLTDASEVTLALLKLYFYDPAGPRLVACGDGEAADIADPAIWTTFGAVLMNDPDRDIEQILADKGKIEAALRAAVRATLALHKQAGNPIAVWRDGTVEWIDVEQLDLEDSEDRTA